MPAFDQISNIFMTAVNKQRTAEYQEILGEVQKEYPALQKHQLSVIPGRGENYAETYPYYEQDNPNPGINTIEIRDRNLTREQIKSIIVGESLHILGGIDPATGLPVDKGFRQYKDQFVNSLTPQQLTVDRMSYRRGQGVEGRPFDQWFDTSRADAYFRGNLFPLNQEEQQDWSEGVTPQQRGLMQSALKYLKGDQ